MAYPYDYFTQSTRSASGAFGNLGNFQEQMNLTEENLWSILNQETPPDEEINRTREIIKKFKLKNRRELFMLYINVDVLQLADIFENFVTTSTLLYGINPLYSYSAPSNIWKTDLKLTNIKLPFIKDEH